jgi:hypothetical protein
MFLLTKFLWKEKYYSKEEYKKYRYPGENGYSYNFRLIMCIITSIFTVLFDILFFLPEILYWFCETLIRM